MEPDNIAPGPSSQTAHHSSTPSNHIDGSQSPESTRITLFSDAISALKDFPFPPSDLRAFNDLQSRTADAINQADISNLQAVRSQLDPLANFLPYLATLHASLAAVESDSPLIPYLLADLRALISSANPVGVSCAHARWVGACRHAVRLAVETHHVARALSLIRPLEEAAAKLAPSKDALVPTHADFLAVCLEAKCYKHATAWIREHRRVIAPATGLTASDVHLIYHYSALVLIGVKDFRPALQCCRLALSVPAPSPGPFFQVALSTFKIYVMLHLLVAGKAPPQLKFSSYQAGRMRKQASEYMELAFAFEKMDVTQTHQIFESNRDVFYKQNSHGLVKQILEELSKRLIVRLTNSFITMHMSDVAKRAGLSSEEEVHSVILDMIRSNKISASIDERKGVVRLMDNDAIEEANISSSMSSEYMNHCLTIVKRIEDFREKLESDPVYVLKELSMQHGKRQGLGSGPFGHGGAGPSSGIAELDQDFMR